MFEKTIFKSYSSFIHLSSRITDPLLIVLAAIVAYGMRFSFTNLHLPPGYRSLILFAVFCVISIFPMFSLYASWRGQSLPKQAKAIFMSWVTVILVMVVILFMLEASDSLSRRWLAWWACIFR